MNVLIVDDSKAMQNIITKAMKSIGYIEDGYRYAVDGEEALAIIQTERFDLILSDMHMPKMTGLELVKALRSRQDATKIVIVSIDNAEKTAADITIAGANAYLQKPFTSEQLFNTITGLFPKPLTKKSSIRYNVREVMPPIKVIERVLSSLAAADVKLMEARFADIDFDRSPYYGGTLQDDQGHVVLAIFLDALAANTVATIIGRRPLEEALAATQAKRIDTAAKQSLLAFLGLFSGLCKLPQSDQLLDIHAEQFAENAHTHLSKHLRQLVDLSVVYSLNCGPSQSGKIIVLSP